MTLDTTLAEIIRSIVVNHPSSRWFEQLVIEWDPDYRHIDSGSDFPGYEFSYEGVSIRAALLLDYVDIAFYLEVREQGHVVYGACLIEIGYDKSDGKPTVNVDRYLPGGWGKVVQKIYSELFPAEPQTPFQYSFQFFTES